VGACPVERRGDRAGEPIPAGGDKLAQLLLGLPRDLLVFLDARVELGDAGVGVV
jgi:hypothetical protein